MQVDTAEFAALTERVAGLEREYSELASRVAGATTAEEIIRRASWPQPATPRPPARRSRPSHLKAVSPIGDQS